MTINYTASEIHSLIERFDSGKLPKSEWTHHAHMVMAIYCGLKDKNPEESLRELIIKHNESVGTPNTDTEGYHETITVFWTRTAQLFIEQNGSTDLVLLCNSFIQQPEFDSSYPLRYYTSELLFSLKARKNFVPPDKLDQSNSTQQ